MQFMLMVSVVWDAVVVRVCVVGVVAVVAVCVIDDCVCVHVVCYVGTAVFLLCRLRC